MKTRASILFVIWSILLIEPLSANFNIQSVYSACGKETEKTSCCMKSKCSKPEKKEEKNDCENNRCNPLMSCPSGNFYFFNHLQLLIDPFLLAKEKSALVDDKRISKHLTECWHPPEII